jgi:2-C-methyl-D-erythritol 2,4-cyclodiphosphate synthase
MNVSAIGQDSHRFEPEGSTKPLILAGITIGEHRGLQGNSDADVVLHALTNAVSGINGVNILGAVSDSLCEKGIKDSSVYLQKAVETLAAQYRIVHVSIAVEAQRPHLAAHIPAMKQSLARFFKIAVEHVGLTATSGEGLTAFGKGEGIQAFAMVTAESVQ